VKEFDDKTKSFLVKLELV